MLETLQTALIAKIQREHEFSEPAFHIVLSYCEAFLFSYAQRNSSIIQPLKDKLLDQIAGWSQKICFYSALETLFPSWIRFLASFGQEDMFILMVLEHLAVNFEMNHERIPNSVKLLL